ncbi:hypothetical protein HQN87_09925 [Paenibacillus tritici]|uniref:Uncharacterized protein n=1 Tax=Paenibacillus tritici TaxID=1873425 RepID=A0ABX2DN51_9BACL|nr:hypothetical protein [Paenibacillus tritici]NQX45647.1 hypothetical protein [Paenibacillus tritici]QUL54104.1 hypothetical protein KDC22_27800 [Paenibacillus tritici]
MNARLKAALLVVLVLAISITGYYGLNNSDSKERIEANGNAVEEDDIGGSNKSYSEQMASWNTPSEVVAMSAISESVVLSPELIKALNEAISGTREEAELTSFIHQYSSKNMEHNQQLISLLIGNEQPELALELATLVWQSNPEAEEAKAQFAKVYNLYTTKVQHKQKETISGGAQ